MKKKLISMVLACSMATSMVASLASCGEKSDPNALKIAVVNVGYGAKWAHKLAEAYMASHEGVTIEVDDTYTGGLDKEFLNELESNETETDIYFSRDSMFDYAQKGKMAGGTYYECLLEDMTTWFNSDNPYDAGTETVLEKIDPDFKRDITVVKNGKEMYYTVPWVNDILGILYNEEVFETYNLTVPTTTDELVQLCYDIKAKGDKDLYPFVDSYADSYFTVLQEHWMTQYEGVAEMEMLWQGYSLPDDNGNRDRYTPEGILARDSFLKVYELFYELMSAENAFIHKDSKDLTFTAAQNYILNSQKKVAMMPNGDWIQREMETNYTADKIEIQMMKMPVLSAIVEKLEYRDGENYMSDAMLAEVIKAIDNGATTYEGVSANDMARLTEARNIVTGWGFGHVGYIPVYSDKKDVAKDFLYFMVSDEGQRIFTEATVGSTQPYDFDYLNDARTSAVMNDFAKGVYKIVKESDVRAYEIAKDPIFAYGGLTISYTWNETSVLTAFTSEPGTKNYMDAETYYSYRLQYYQSKWQNVLTSAGIQ